MDGPFPANHKRMQNIFSFPVAQAGVISDAPKVSSLLLNISNFLLSIISIVAIIALIVAGLFYLTAYGDQERLGRAKKIALAALVGIVIAFGALIITKTVTDIFG